MTDQTHNSWVRSAGFGLGVLSFINLFSYLDRYIVSALTESLKHSNMGLSDANLGSLMSGFLIVYTLTAPIFGALGDRRSRPRLIAVGVACWSFATALSGFAGSYLALFLARASVGVGEAAYVTIAPSLLSDYFPARDRGRVMAIFFCAIPVGSALGYVVGGLIDKHYGWRSAFFVAGAPGLLLAALCLLLRDPPRGASDSGAAPAAATPEKASNLGKDTWATFGRLLHNKPYVLTVLAYAAYTFALGGLAFWMPAFLERSRGIPRSEATVSFGTIVVITGFIGTFV
ncbi:MAG TPA: MFS transporter, partial [Steroidobacteraceae bacterium]